MRIPKKQRQPGFGYRASRITYHDVIFGIITNLGSQSDSGLSILQATPFEQKIIFVSLMGLKKSTSCLLSNLEHSCAYLWLTSIIQNALVWLVQKCLPEEWQSCSDLKIRSGTYQP